MTFGNKGDIIQNMKYTDSIEYNSRKSNRFKIVYQECRVQLAKCKCFVYQLHIMVKMKQVYNKQIYLQPVIMYQNIGLLSSLVSPNVARVIRKIYGVK